jgi:hypothetical protein
MPGEVWDDWNFSSGQQGWEAATILGNVSAAWGGAGWESVFLTPGSTELRIQRLLEEPRSYDLLKVDYTTSVDIQFFVVVLNQLENHLGSVTAGGGEFVIDLNPVTASEIRVEMVGDTGGTCAITRVQARRI